MAHSQSARRALQPSASTLRDRRSIIGRFLFGTNSFNSWKRMILHTMKDLSDGCRPLRGLAIVFNDGFLGFRCAHAPGFMITTASRANCRSLMSGEFRLDPL